jgi:hypothetical protein
MGHVFWSGTDLREVAQRALDFVKRFVPAKPGLGGLELVEGQLAGSLLEPADPDWVAALFEHGSGRGEDPGERPSTT